ncbi:hypothetical protein HMPREF9713_02065 [Myroides odoratimimus CCUG 12700]|nr:hypothetical protein HMPREF9713_02065 [Myroides odoratimimus CCUG 12700]
MFYKTYKEVRKIAVNRKVFSNFALQLIFIICYR